MAWQAGLFPQERQTGHVLRQLGSVGVTSVRFTVRKVTKGWMVWDTLSMKVAIVDDMPAIGVSAETAKRFADMLNSQQQLTSDADERDDAKRQWRAAFIPVAS